MDSIDPRAERLSMAVLSILPLCSRRMADQAKRDSDKLTPAQMQTLMVLKMEGRALSMSQLARALHVSKQQLTKQVDALCLHGLAERNVAPDNRRVVLVQLTASGRSFLKSVLHRRSVAVRRFFSGLSAEEEDTLLKAFSLLRRLLEQDCRREEK